MLHSVQSSKHRTAVNGKMTIMGLGTFEMQVQHAIVPHWCLQRLWRRLQRPKATPCYNADVRDCESSEKSMLFGSVSALRDILVPCSPADALGPFCHHEIHRYLSDVEEGGETAFPQNSEWADPRFVAFKFSPLSMCTFAAAHACKCNDSICIVAFSRDGAIAAFLNAWQMRGWSSVTVPRGM
jgi:hypothetical protein